MQAHIRVVASIQTLAATWVAHAYEQPRGLLNIVFSLGAKPSVNIRFMIARCSVVTID